ncbi:hypothetical protein ACFPPD_06665 [Cohnella suwonensis]|uniref:Uncharacterized protein n=1 Tax=Cohnella suwonensis TaxID=696072 RepID=A0ABW0LUN2_9BACL
MEHVEEYVMISHNFKLLIGVIINDRTVTGMVEQIDEDDRFLLSGEWYRLQDIVEIVSCYCHESGKPRTLIRGLFLIPPMIPIPAKKSEINEINDFRKCVSSNKYANFCITFA